MKPVKQKDVNVEGRVEAAPRRMTVIDALRGFALLGVILTHMWQHYSIPSWGLSLRAPLFAGMDDSIQWLMQHVAPCDEA